MLIRAVQGTGLLDDGRFAIGPGDAWLCKVGHRHGSHGNSLRVPAGPKKNRPEYFRTRGGS